MTEQQRRVQPDLDDVQGHGFRRPGADAESAESDTEGHMPRLSGGTHAEKSEGADTEGHMGRHGGADTEAAEDDTEGHGRRLADAEQAEGDDVEGHMYIPAERDELNSQRLR